MIIFKDAFTNDELCSDSFPMKLYNDLIYEFKGKYVIRKEGAIILPGSNPSAEANEEEGSDEQVERGIDFVLNHRLREVNCYEDKDLFKSYIKKFVKNAIDYLAKNGKSAEEIDIFKKKIKEWVESILSKNRFKNLQFFIGENTTEDLDRGQLAIVEYREENGVETPFLMLIKATIIEEKA